MVSQDGDKRESALAWMISTPGSLRLGQGLTSRYIDHLNKKEYELTVCKSPKDLLSEKESDKRKTTKKPQKFGYIIALISLKGLHRSDSNWYLHRRKKGAGLTMGVWTKKFKRRLSEIL